ncbi:MAG: C69 family dipeptidase [Bacteroidales bacterium]|nr:C69 family dipeptidase [Bacteroidales bacterium]
MKKILLFSAMVACMALFASAANGQNAIRQGVDVEGENCFAIIAGKAATVDGSVLFAHNEDDSGEQMLNVYIVPAGSQPAMTDGGLKIPASIANGYTDKRGNKKHKVNGKFFWLEFPGMSVADAAMNQWGVCIASDGCNSREDKEDLTDGGILYDVRINVAKYARSARDAAKIIGEAVEQYGYKGSGRTYCVADPNEGWIVAVVKGRHWVAQRVPDDKVMAIPNYYTITTVNLDDKENFMGSPDIIDYAISRGWYDPHSRQEFNFRLAYSDPKRIDSDGNTKRHKAVIEYITEGKYNYDPYSVQPMFTPAKKLSVKDMIVMLSLHNEREKRIIKGAPQEPAFGKEDPRHISGVCTDVTIVSTIFQLRSWMPLETGCIMWMCPGRPCAEVFVPWYLGMTKDPAGWARFDDWQEAEQHHFSDAKNMEKDYPEHPYWFFTKRWKELNSNYSYWIRGVQENKWQMQYDILKKSSDLEKNLPSDLKKSKNRKQAEQMLNQFTADIYNTVLSQKTIRPKSW